MAETVLDALTRVPNPQGRAIRFLDLAELDFADARPDFITHAELQARVTAMANAFRALAGKDAPVVTILTPSTIDGLVALLAAEVAGAAHPVNWLLDADGIADCMNAVGADLVVTPGPRPGLDTHGKLMAAMPGVPSLRGVISTGRVGAGEHGMRALIGEYPSDRLMGRQPAPGDIAALFHTAGTTGKSKVVPLSHANLLAAAEGIAEAWNMAEDTRIVNALPFFHVAGANLLALGPLCRGGEVLLLTETGLRNPAVLARHWQIVEATRPTIIGAIPSSLIALLDVPLNGADISSVRFCATGGAPMPAVAAAAFERQFGLPVHTIYGMTETAGLIATARFEAVPDYATAGRIAPGIMARVRPLSGDELSEDPDVTGVICVKGRQLFAGYPDQAKGGARFLADGWLETGDMGRISAHGAVTILGRSNDIIIRAGNNIDPSVIERAANRFPGVAESAAIAMPDRYAGEVPALYVVPRAGQVVPLADLERHMREYLAEPHARPAHIFVTAKLPLTVVGKLSRVALRRQAAQEAIGLALREQGLNPELELEQTPDGGLLIRTGDQTSLPQLRDVVAALGLHATVAAA